MELPSEATTRGKFEIYIPQEFDLPLGTLVHPIIEMNIDGSPHPQSWTRLPNTGPWFDWNLARSWGLKLQWRANPAEDKWSCVYLAASQILTPRSRELYEPGAFNTYAQGIAIFRFLRQLRLNQEGRPAWLYDYGIARLKEAKLDWLTQTIEITDVVPKNQTVRHSRPKPDWDMQYDLEAAGLSVWRPYGQLDQPSTRVRSPRGACDSCYLYSLASRTRSANGVSENLILHPRGY